MLVKRRPPRPKTTEHPTKRALIDTVVAMLDSVPVGQVTCDSVLAASGISRGSLYYHFEDFSDLVEHALVLRYSRYVNDSIAAIESTLSQSASAEEFRERFVETVRAGHDSSKVALRLEQVIPLAAAAGSERMRTALGLEQQRYTDAHVGVLREAQANGWVAPGFDPRALSVLVQAFLLGRAVDDVAPSPLEPQAWEAVLAAVLDRVLLTR